MIKTITLLILLFSSVFAADESLAVMKKDGYMETYPSAFGYAKELRKEGIFSQNGYYLNIGLANADIEYYNSWNTATDSVTTIGFGYFFNYFIISTDLVTYSSMKISYLDFKFDYKLELSKTFLLTYGLSTPIFSDAPSFVGALVHIGLHKSFGDEGLFGSFSLNSGYLNTDYPYDPLDRDYIEFDTFYMMLSIGRKF